jgi:riboflavin biosynthesis pyrimidine reductase
LRVALKELGRMEVTSVMVEGGAELHRALFAERLVDRIAYFVAPIVIGGVAKVSQAKRVAGKTLFVEGKVVQ